MPLAQPLAELRQNLEAQIREGQLPDALNALLAQLPEGSETYRIVSALIARLNAANKERYRNTISSEEYQRRMDQVSADFFDLLSGLKERDFLPAEAQAPTGKSGKVGSVLYRVPHVMTIQKPVRCTIRVAVNEDAILENIVLDEHVEVKSRIEISDVMSAELVDPEGGTFQINPLNKHTQLIKETGYTEWNFNVTPLIEGVHQLLVKVSIMEMVPGFAEPIPREVSLMETVTIVTESSPAYAKASAGKSDTPSEEFKPSGQTFAFQSTSTAQGNYEINYSKSAELPPQSPNPSMPKSYNRNLRAMALFLAFLVIVPAATFAIAPDFPAYVLATIQDTPEAYADFIENHPNSPRVEKAYFYRAEASGRLADLRAYQEKFENGGKFETKVLGRIAALETKSLESIRERPEPMKFRQFVTDFPESERLTDMKQAMEARAENRQELLPLVEDAYVKSIQMQPTETKIAAYLRDFPKQNKLNEVIEAAATKPEVLEKTRPVFDEAITRKMAAATTANEVRNLLPALESAGSSQTAAKVEKILEQKPQIRKQVQQQVHQSVERIRQRELGLGMAPTTPMNESERLDWDAALQANTAGAFVDFVNKYPKTSKLPEARIKINSLKPALSREEQAWAEATLANAPEAYIYFVQKYTQSAHNAEARSRIKSFSLSKIERKRLEAKAAERLRNEKVGKTKDQPKQEEEMLLGEKFDIGMVDKKGLDEDLPMIDEPAIDAPIEEPAGERIFEMFDIQKEPSFPGGQSEMYKFISSNLIYPALARENGISGKVVLTFIVEKNGSLSDINVIKDIGGGCGKEAVRVVRSMPRWSPGEANGRILKVRYTLPVTFRLE